MYRRALSIVVDVLVAVLAVTMLWGWYTGNRTAPTKNGPMSAYNNRHVGQKLDTVPIDWHGSKATWVMALSTTCHYCTESAPFFRELLTAVGTRGRVIAIFPHDEAAARAYLDNLNVKVPSVFGRTMPSWPTATPTLLLCDANGVVVKEWVGRLNSQQQAEVFHTVSERLQ